MTPEEKAWQQNGAQLTASGGSVQTKDEILLSASRDIVVCELSFAIGEPDYTLFVDAKVPGTAGAKPTCRHRTLTSMTSIENKFAYA